MKSFVSLYQSLDSSTKTGDKVLSLVRFLETCDVEDRIWLLALFTGRRPKRSIKLSDLRKWASEFAGIPDWLFDESYHVVGDLAETIALILSDGEGADEGNLNDWMGQLKELRELDAETQKKWLFESWARLSGRGRFLLNKLITGGFRVGVSESLLVQALEKYTGISRSEWLFRLSGNWDPYQTSFEQFLMQDASESDRSKPYPFYLSYALESPISELGAVSEWQLEYKWDGIRAQLIHRDGQVSLWSRGEELITPAFPEIAETANLFERNVVLDGELVCWDFEGSKVRKFGDLQKRLGRKSAGKKLRTDYPVKFLAYDMMELDGVDLRSQPMGIRRSNLEDFLGDEGIGNIGISECIEVGSWEDAAAARAGAKARGVEGLMIKRLDSVYGTGRRRGDWWKWKIDPETIDAVMVYAQRGHGRRANLYSDFTFALWKTSADGNRELVPFAKAYSGLTDKELTEINHWIKDHTRESFGPVRSVDAELVFELAFEGVQASKRHKSGVAVRFPRIVRWRRDKPVSEVGSVEELLGA